MVKKTVTVLSLVLTIALTACGGSNGGESTGGGTGGGGVGDNRIDTPWVNGYYVLYQDHLLPAENIYWKGLTHITVGTVLANADGTLDTSFYGRSSNTVKQIASLAKQNNVKPLLMLGGAGNGTAIAQAVTNHFELFASNLLSTMNDYGYAGIDLDWEDHVNWDQFELLAKTLRERSPDMLLTAPTGVINPNIESNNELIAVFKRLEPYLDQIGIMSYGATITLWYGDGWYSGHSSALKTGMNPISIEDSLSRYAAAGIPKKKLSMGIGFFAVGYAGGITAPGQAVPSDLFRGGDNDYPLAALYASKPYLYAQDNGCIKWDSNAECSYVSLPANQTDIFGCQYVSFEDEKSIAAKGAFCRDNGYGGAIIWTINQGYVKEHSAGPNFIMQAIRKAFIEPDFPLEPAATIFPKAAFVKPGAAFQFRALATGSESKAVQWSSSAGSVSNGMFTAPTTSGTHTISATLNGKTVSADITVSDVVWSPLIIMDFAWPGWTEILCDEKDQISSITIEHNDIFTRMEAQHFRSGFQVSANIQAGVKIRLHIEAANGRACVSEEFLYYHDPLPDDPDYGTHKKTIIAIDQTQ